MNPFSALVSLPGRSSTLKEGELRDELLNGGIFDTLLEAKMLIEEWRRWYNHVQPYSALDYRPLLRGTTSCLVPSGLGLGMTEKQTPFSRRRVP
ncbi:transposase [bacterium]|nr:transposase [bacterium]